MSGGSSPTRMENFTLRPLRVFPFATSARDFSRKGRKDYRKGRKDYQVIPNILAKNLIGQWSVVLDNRSLIIDH